MRCRLLMWAVFIGMWSWGYAPALAQSAGAPQGETFLGRLDTFGRSVFNFGGNAPSKPKAAAEPAYAAPHAQPQVRAVPQTQPMAAVPRMASQVPAQAAHSPRPERVDLAARERVLWETLEPEDETVVMPAAAPRQVAQIAPQVVPQAVPQVVAPIVSQPQSQLPSPRATIAAQSPGSGSPVVPGVVPIHQRMSGLRQSMFSGGSQPASTPVARSNPSPAPAANHTPIVKSDTPRVAERPVHTPIVSSPAAPIRSTGPAAEKPAVASPAATSPSIAPPAALPPDTRAIQPKTDSPSKTPANENLFTRRSPVISVETIGPRKIAVGKEASYEVVLQNAGEVAAEQVVVTIDLPEWTDVVGSEASVGNTASGKGDGSASEYRWRISRLDAKARERLQLKIVPRESRPFELVARWDCEPATPPPMIEVQSPKLKIDLVGPREILFGKGEVYRLEVANHGTGDAENVTISLTPSAPGEKQPPASHRFGGIGPGQKKSIDVELTARQTGDLVIRVEARGDAGLFTELTERIEVRRATLKIAIEAPSVHFVGAEATYRIRVTNPGTAPAQNVAVTATLPSGTRFLSSPQGGRLENQNTVRWTLDLVGPGAESVIAMNCDSSVPGVSRLEVQCGAEGNLATSALANIQVEAVPKLVLSVDDPSGPVMIDNDAVYEIRVNNRGSASAEKVEVVAYFSKGFEPTSAEGGKYKVSPGQVVFDPIPSLAAGQSQVLKVKARAETPGSHIFRVEVRSDPAGSRLVREGTTRFFGSEGLSSTGIVRSNENTVPARTADRRDTSIPSPLNPSSK